MSWKVGATSALGDGRKRPRQSTRLPHEPEHISHTGSSYSLDGGTKGGRLSGASASPQTGDSLDLLPSDHEYDADSDADGEEFEGAPSKRQALHSRGLFLRDERPPRKRPHLSAEAEVELGRNLSGMSLCLSPDLQLKEESIPLAPPSSPTKDHSASAHFSSSSQVDLFPSQGSTIHPASSESEMIGDSQSAEHTTLDDVAMKIRRGPSSYEVGKDRVVVTTLSDTSSDDGSVSECGEKISAEATSTESQAGARAEDGSVRVHPKLLSKLEDLQAALVRDSAAARLGLHAGEWGKRRVSPLSGSVTGGHGARSQSVSPRPTSPTNTVLPSREESAAALILWKRPEDLLGTPTAGGSSANSHETSVRRQHPAASFSFVSKAAAHLQQVEHSEFDAALKSAAPNPYQHFGTSPLHWPTTRASSTEAATHQKSQGSTLSATWSTEKPSDAMDID
ncbi:hypothetical protein IE81DRAFT_179657 [Ceraceosorus guamensis]|uniref:Uncharacterized protein n=1 Tax=Ceraceosorus guamensis TaxID=1522189 RepID=A0A316VUZ6_9BASI|nr:hypothetical protein IE81DRAFT_179657 [Ceraceosorus guamensis]PWN41280.1 hypothetical protein IE81DRAFT_179657 [Ceraceosorus guamensis]